MKKLTVYLLISLPIIAFWFGSCADKVSENTMTVTGNVKGLKKGTLMLQHITDSILVTVDSLEVDGDGSFSFRTDLDSPQIYYLYLKKMDGNEINDRITFFAEPGTITIRTAWISFDTDAKIEGSAAHKKWEEYLAVMSRFNAKNLELIQSAANRETPLDSLQTDSLQRLSDTNLKRGYAFALNFALNNKDSYVAPYIALTEVSDANIVYLDSIHNSLTPSVADSKYGRELAEHVEKVKGKME